MEQTFNDLCRERQAAGKGLSGFVLWVSFETLAGILRENMAHVAMHNKQYFIRPLLVTVGILLIPLFGNMFVDGWNWSWTAFPFFGVILFGAGVSYELAGKFARTGVISGFVFGEFVAAGVIAILRYMNPEEDVAGVVIITFLFCGILCASFGYLIQKRIKAN